ncbi:amidohydrolase [Pseudoflavonifractor sp. 524-17]|uniref:M20 family metallopeptidase n=1 Tax=Pseudoflavonifractor sp. 524-17 TaxID=2304577 RepID=UPI00137A6F6B|nr:M20 family metallopeptidase [Pseudoflavonifractor sp. 524-17]NCE65384.1 amidohydrolase [Pseudoflavonifractor sp. 524-17]
MMNEIILEAAQALYPQLKAVKDDIHRHPELAFQEHRTTKVIKDQLLAMGLHLIDTGMETGAAAWLEGGAPGPTVALRADIDAIEQQEPADNGVVSEEAGVMHGCGHDFHTVCLLGAARLLAQRRGELRGNVAFLFQPAEEITQGAAAMLSRGLWDRLPQKPTQLFGLHTRPEVPRGQVAVIPGAVMAGKSHFFITLTGVTGHCGAPHKCVDVIVAGAAIVNGIQTIVSRNTDPQDPLVCAVFSINAGTPENFVPETLTMTGDIRAHSDEVIQKTQNRLEALAKGIAASYQCGCEVRFVPEVPVTDNRPEMVRLARRAAAAVVGEENIVQPRGDMGSEDFAVFGREVPAFFYWLGTGFPGQSNPCWHNERFKTDDSALPLGAALLAQSVLETMEEFGK